MAQTPDLQSVLATLAQLSQQRPQQHDIQRIDNSLSTFQGDAASASASEPLLSGINSEVNVQTRPIIDPATITTWQEGLRCVTKIAAQNKAFESSIRRMMKEQRQLELQWAADRNALKRLQANRNQSSADALSILKSLNSGTSADQSHDKGIDHENELRLLDVKLHEKQRSYQSSAMLELKHLGVPFFGTPKELIVSEAQLSNNASNDDRPKYSVLVTENELRRLQKKMIDHLEDLYRE